MHCKNSHDIVSIISKYGGIIRYQELVKLSLENLKKNYERIHLCMPQDTVFHDSYPFRPHLIKACINLLYIIICDSVRDIELSVGLGHLFSALSKEIIGGSSLASKLCEKTAMRTV
jgi:hypothetical protein